MRREGWGFPKAFFKALHINVMNKKLKLSQFFNKDRLPIKEVPQKYLYTRKYYKGGAKKGRKKNIFRDTILY